MEYIHRIPSPMGAVTMASDGKSLIGLWIDGQKYDRATLAECREERELPVFRQTEEWLRIYFSGKEPDFMPPLAPRGTAFRQEVWELLREIPYGGTVTYGSIAAEIAKKHGKERMSAQAVGGAVGHNPISILIPCHRVIGADGSLTGYAGGVDKKAALLALERGEKTFDTSV